MTRYLYLARHGEATADELALTGDGRRQAALLGERLSGVPLDAIHHGPLPRAAQTARLIGAHLPGVPLLESAAAGDYVPYRPSREELPPAQADYYLRFVAQFPADSGDELAAEAMRTFTGPVMEGTRHELVVTHNFLIGWLVRATLDAPKWRWLGLNHDNAALTVIRYAPDRPPALACYNDTGHLLG
ncbi:histidine phosphatase family protein [Nonomuraea sp. NBC_01738]|uniref:histidine phosphatase family protein n=1 Tax=Nonomuraea sp. NBC_01738 TaxID=2976003 RepID=UPI002E140884|nr:histidine phosphatase family protein [Nonomuraea sp. NBC_01738]